jgi:hypothetical protein
VCVALCIEISKHTFEHQLILSAWQAWWGNQVTGEAAWEDDLELYVFSDRYWYQLGEETWFWVETGSMFGEDHAIGGKMSCHSSHVHAFLNCHLCVMWML